MKTLQLHLQHFFYILIEGFWKDRDTQKDCLLNNTKIEEIDKLLEVVKVKQWFDQDEEILNFEINKNKILKLCNFSLTCEHYFTKTKRTLSINFLL